MSIGGVLALILISDFLPIITQMACLWLSGTKKFDSLISGFLCPPAPGDESTYAGSVILDDLR